MSVDTFPLVGDARSAPPLCAIVAVVDPRVRRGLLGVLGTLGVERTEIEPAHVCGPTRRGAVYCLDTSTAGAVPRLPLPAVVITVGSAVPDRLLSIVTGGAATVAITAEELTPERLLDAFLHVTLGASLDHLTARLAASFPLLDRMPRALLRKFVAAPKSMKRQRDVERVLRISAKTARRLVRDAGFDRAEHLLTVMRVELWLWCAARGVERAAFEEYLGINDRRTFRRACRRAGIPAPCNASIRDNPKA